MEKPIGMHISAMEPHNMYLWLWAEHGLLAGAAFVLALVAPLVSLWRLDPRGDPEAASARAVYVALLAGFLVVFLTSSWLLLTPQFACFYWLFVFTGLHAAARVRGEDGA